MATTNMQLIEDMTMSLALSGTIKPDEEIHTFAHWKSLGFSVRKGEKAVVSFPIWKYSTSKKSGSDETDGENGEKTGKMFMKNSHFFSTSQVEKITPEMKARWEAAKKRRLERRKI